MSIAVTTALIGYPIILITLQIRKILSKKFLFIIITIALTSILILTYLRSKYPICSHEANTYLEYILAGYIILGYSMTVYLIKRKNITINKLLGIDELVNSTENIHDTSEHNNNV